MGALGSWRNVADTYQFQIGQTVRVRFNFSTIPATAPSSDEINAAFTSDTDFSVISISPDVATATGIISSWDVTQTSYVMIGTVMAGFTAGQLRGDIYNAISSLTAGRVSPLWSANVGDIQITDDRSTFQQVLDLAGDNADNGGSSDSGGFAASTTTIVVAIALAIIAIAYVVGKVA